MFIDTYYQKTLEILNKISEEETQTIQRVAVILANVFKDDGLLYVFGCGHSHMIEDEMFYRAGGLAPVSPIYETSTMLHEGAAKSSQIERMSGYAPLLLKRYDVTPEDAFLIASTSGINSFPIEMVQAAKKAGAITIGISSSNYLDQPSRQKDGLHLADICDITINNHVPVGDAVVEVNQNGIKAGPISTIATLFIANSLMLAACEKLVEWGVDPKIYRSGNCPGGDEYNDRLISLYKSRIKHL